MRLIIIAVLLYTTLKVVSSCYIYSIEQEKRVDHRQPLPAKCTVYYNDGTDRWKDCMGVGYVREEDNDHD